MKHILVICLLAEIYADPNHSSYDALQFVSGIATTFTPVVIFNFQKFSIWTCFLNNSEVLEMALTVGHFRQV